ncbi:MAG: hypothetical protein ABEH81_08535 [Halopenitus sp.]
MPLSTSQETILNQITQGVPEEATWCIFGSTDSVLRGLDDDPSDIDILATEEAAKQFRELFSGGFVKTQEVGHSQMDEYQVNGEEIEVIYSHSEKTHQKPLVRLDERELVTSDDRGIPMLPLHPLIHAYRQIDKNETANRLESRFELSGA